MSYRALICAMTIAGVVLGAASAEAATTCTWGGTPAAPTGISTNSPALYASTPAPDPLQFRATGALAGGCRGRVTFTGEMNAGSTCGVISLQGTTGDPRHAWGGLRGVPGLGQGPLPGAFGGRTIAPPDSAANFRTRRLARAVHVP